MKNIKYNFKENENKEFALIFLCPCQVEQQKNYRQLKRNMIYFGDKYER